METTTEGIDWGAAAYTCGNIYSINTRATKKNRADFLQALFSIIKSSKKPH